MKVVCHLSLVLTDSPNYVLYCHEITIFDDTVKHVLSGHPWRMSSVFFTRDVRSIQGVRLIQGVRSMQVPVQVTCYDTVKPVLSGHSQETL